MNLSSKAIVKELINAIIQGKYPAGSSLQSERELAVSFQVGRPTIREVLQRLSHGGWLTLRKGQSAIVNDYWQEGNVTTIVNIVQYCDDIPDEFVLYFLEMRIAMTPQYVKNAINLHHPKVVGILAKMDELMDQPEDYALFDWKLQKELASLSENPIFLLTLNSFEGAYIEMATRYFSLSYSRKASYNYYKELMAAALKGDSRQAERLTKSMMEKSYALWNSHISEGKQSQETIN
ncbi:GntR family transcriptional regulator [Virgibacillus doumboii]|uniref:GntR family transcriptional regulator n=1 Tax=Virgibacillus doumboii TaxID=2697503 RepID=UPI0013DF7B54|nr:GntR family transcriptional regulator [Virgibacillus doumboii]